MERLREYVRVLIDRSFWREFIECDMCEESRMMHEVFEKGANKA